MSKKKKKTTQKISNKKHTVTELAEVIEDVTSKLISQLRNERLAAKLKDIYKQEFKNPADENRQLTAGNFNFIEKTVTIPAAYSKHRETDVIPLRDGTPRSYQRTHKGQTPWS